LTKYSGRTKDNKIAATYSGKGKNDSESQIYSSNVGKRKNDLERQRN